MNPTCEFKVLRASDGSFQIEIRSNGRPHTICQISDNEAKELALNIMNLLYPKTETL